jgi:tRNA(Ile)-lysidine synthase
MHPLEVKIRRLVTRHALVDPDSRVLVGVSGGADSLALLHLLAAMRGDVPLTLIAVYVDHGLRPSETPAEWDCVRQAAVRLDVDCACASVDVRGLATSRKLSLEHAAREARYQAFRDLARERATDRLAVAHTADDQVEEVLLRLFRGGGRKGLSGMRMRAGDLIRPLLTTRKAELLAYLQDRKIGYCQDSSNVDRRFLRNRIRLDLLPLLERVYDPGIRHALLKTAANLSEDEDLLEQLLADCWETVVAFDGGDVADRTVCRLGRAPFRSLHPALQRRLVERLLWILGCVARYQQILAVLDAARSGRTGSELHLSQGLRVRVERTFLEFSYPRGQGPWRGRLSER